MNHKVIRTRHLVSTAILVLIGTVAGCSAENDDESPVDVQEDTLTEANNASQISLAADRVLALKLDGRTSLGNSWQVDSIDTGVLRVADAELDPGPDLGGTDKQILRFVGVSKGTTVLTLKYGRPWESTPEKTYSVKVDVSGEYVGGFRPAQVVSAAAVDQEQPLVGMPTHYSVCEQGGCTPVKDQGGCGSCLAFATTAVVESAILTQDKVSRDLSEQYLVSCSDDTSRCDGGWTAFHYFVDKVPSGERGAGAVYESDFPYTATNATCDGPYPHHEKLKSVTAIDNPSVNSIKQAILDHGSVWTTVCADGEFSNYRPGTIFRGSNCPGINHAVVLVGWDDNGGDGYWILRNSWGSNWGDHGYMKIKWGANFINGTPYYVTYGDGGGGGDDGGGDTSCPVKLFADANFGGNSTCLGAGRWDIDKLRATIGNDTVSSVKVASGYRATLYAARAFRSTAKVLTRDTSSLPGFNDVASSVIVERR